MLTATQMVWLALVINAVAAVLYMIVMGIRMRQRYVLSRGIIMLLCPGTAVLVYFFSYLGSLFLHEKDVDYDNISMSKERKIFLQMVDKELESNVIPIEAALTVADTSDRREIMLNLLKMDVSENIGLIRRAVENEDTETSHYAASALTEAVGKYTAELNVLRERYEMDRTSGKSNRDYIDAVVRVLEKDILDGEEKRKYLYILTDLIKNLRENHFDELREEDYIGMVKALCETGELLEADKWAMEAIDREPEKEETYLSALKVKYLLRKEEEFTDILDKLRRSGIFLSRRGVEMVAFWTNKE
ncbi:MAG: hypothetical protein LUI07_07195 [Lachnospiraceae bacterium]|nr:hypothetical protein [Lachnospiraceae bacterium]